MDGHSQFLTVIHNRACEPTELTGFFDPDGYGMPGCPMFNRSVHINRQADRPVKPDLVGNSANSFATQTVRHMRNPHGSGIFTFFSFEKGSNFVQKSRHNRTSSTRWSVSFIFILPAASHIPANSFGAQL